MKVAEDAAVAELPLNDERVPEKKGRHVTIALNHLHKQRSKLVAAAKKLANELNEIEEAIAALE